ncbi:putative methyltransferase MTA70 [Cardiosporidium cionae]|uniref:Methyltransferase MTA70 n=1 Tax=Cardiosporidium cionae TaxID=476202 RepID=A0ABQ7J7S3_9APIC|nr:putative methyltransferase MTA70 [Cardiosporidium cionae]|eukprot:KAF8819989.1 putative methyltransferase MTA70 [Cardiosporidium cionae]
MQEQRLLDTGEELRQLLAEPTARQTITARGFQNKQGTQLREICIHGTQEECCRISHSPFPCENVHFRRIILPHTDPSLGDCSYLDTCRHIETCKFVHYEVDRRINVASHGKLANPYDIGTVTESSVEDIPAQWIRCDIRKFDVSFLRHVNITVVMADPPWDIHMDLPYGTMTDQEMRGLQINQIQQEGLLFLWVTGRAMELARECMELWGYHRVEEIVWVKTNQLQRIIRTGRTGHWLNHSKEHCLVGMKGNIQVNKNLDCDVIVSEVRETSRKPDEIYRIIERLCPNSLKLELFGRQHNVRNNWITLGNQLDGVELHVPILREKYNLVAISQGLPKLNSEN